MSKQAYYHNIVKNSLASCSNISRDNLDLVAQFCKSYNISKQDYLHICQYCSDSATQEDIESAWDKAPEQFIPHTLVKDFIEQSGGNWTIPKHS